VILRVAVEREVRVAVDAVVVVAPVVVVAALVEA